MKDKIEGKIELNRGTSHLARGQTTLKSQAKWPKTMKKNIYDKFCRSFVFNGKMLFQTFDMLYV